MADMSEALQSILSDPSAMQQIKELGGMLGLGSDRQKEPEKQQDGISSLLSSLGGSQNSSMPESDMLGMMMKLAPLLSSVNEENDSTRLLNALRPFLSEKGRGRIDSTIRLMSLMRILPMLKGVF
jgi:hypothetical protein